MSRYAHIDTRQPYGQYANCIPAREINVMRNRSAALPLLLNTAAGTVGGMLGLAWYAGNQLNPRPRRTYLDDYTFTPWELDAPYEDVTLHTPDGLRLGGWWLLRPETQSVVICCHGHISAKHDLLGIGTGIWRAGHNVLLFDFRGRGTSDPWPNTLAHREVDDLLTAADYVRKRIAGARIGLVGFSMGAAVALLVAARDPTIQAIVADSSFTNARDVTADRMRHVLHVPVAPLVTLTEALIRQRYGYRLSDIRPIDAIGKLAPRPVLIIHGANDSLIPVAHARQLFAAAHQPKELWIDEHAEHCGAYFTDRRAYVRRVTEFFDQYLLSI
jgi:pimeloyl-ACP methyl ester carboxylesterase